MCLPSNRPVSPSVDESRTLHTSFYLLRRASPSIDKSLPL
jgi:hypothetical protein